MSGERLSDDEVLYIERRCGNEHFTLPWEKAVALAREVQERRAAEPTFTSVVHDCCVTAAPIDDLCARHDITVEGIVALVGEVFTDSINDGVVLSAVKGGFRRLARGEDA